MAINGTLNDNTTLNDTIAITQQTGTKVTLNTANKYITKNIELTCDVSDNNLTAGNIKNGVTILGVTGNYTGEGLLITETLDSHGGTVAEITATNSLMLQSKTVTPTTTAITVQPDTGYSALSEVVVQAMPSSIQLQEKSVTPTTSQQIIIPDNGYSGLSSVTVAAAPSINWMGKNATLIKSWVSKEIALTDLPTFSNWDRSTTTSAVLRTDPGAADTFTVDLTTYDYYVIYQLEVDYVYTGAPATAIKGKPIRQVAQNVHTYTARTGATYANITSHTYGYGLSTNLLTSAIYYTTNAAGTSTSIGYNQSYGIYLTNVAHTFGTGVSQTITLKEPTIYGRCSSTYLATSHAQLIDTTNTKVKLTGKVYRVDKSGYLGGAYDSLVNLFNNGGGGT